MVTDGEGMVELGGGLPALPPRPVIPQRQINASLAVPLRVPDVQQQAVETKPLILPSGSDLGAVGKIGVYQLAHTSHTSAAASFTPLHYLWIYSMIAIFFIFVIKR